MRGPIQLSLFAGLLLSVLAQQSLFAGPYEGQIRLAPESTNLIVFVDAQALYNTELSKSEDWKQKVKDAYLAGDALVPPTANRIVMLAEVDPLNNLRPIWDMSVLDLYKAPDVLGFAKNEQAEIEHLDGKRLVQTHTGALVLEVKTQRILASALATRQLFSRSLSGAEKPSRISEFLKKAADELPSQGQVCIALDLDKVITRAVAKNLLGKDATSGAIECLTSLKGLTCVVNVDKARKATIRLEFSQKVDALGSDPHKTLQPVLDAFGFSDESLGIITPKGSKDSHAVIIKGELLPERLRMLFRQFEATGTNHDYGTSEAEAAPPDPKQVTIVATQKNFKAVQSLLNELKSTATRDRIAELSEKYAAKIDALPMLNVDPDMLTFQANVSGSLRYQAQAKREAGLRTGVRASIPTYDTYAYGVNAYGGYGAPYYGAYGSYAFYRPQVANTAQIATQEQAPATQLRISETKAINDGLAKLRRTLTERYMVEF